MAENHWNLPGRIERLTECLRLGMSASEIAQALNVGSKHPITRNAVIGKLARMGMRRPEAAPKVQRQPKFRKRKWSAEEDAALTDLSQRGVLRTEAAKELGIGIDVLRRRAAKLNLSWVSPAPVSRQNAGPKDKWENLSGDALAARRKERIEIGLAKLAAFAAPANDDAIPLMARRRGQCAWPVGDPARPSLQLCCGQRVTVGTSSYCDRHRRIGTTGQVVSARELTRALRRYA